MALAFLAAAGAAPAQMPWMGGGDARIQAIEYRNNQVVRIRAAQGYQVTIELASDEHIVSVALGDMGAWQVSANKAGNLLFVKPLQADVPTNMTVVTDVRTYNFELVGVAEPAGDLPFTVRFLYPSGSPAIPPMGAALMNGMPGMAGMPGSPTTPAVADYKLHGDKSLFPKAMSDDGTRTYIDWPPDGPLPAVYSLDGDGRETLVNGNMRGKLFVIDEVDRQLVFRIDRRRARAVRVLNKAKKP